MPDPLEGAESQGDQWKEVEVDWTRTGRWIHETILPKMGHWGVKSYEHDEANDALDAGFDRVHGARYEELMDDSNPLTFDQVQATLSDSQTLVASIDALRDKLVLDDSPANWDELARLAFVGIVVRHAELRVPIPEPWGRQAIEWLEHEDIEWDETTARRLRRGKEIAFIRKALGIGGNDHHTVVAPEH
jgi:hypothetical protein